MQQTMSAPSAAPPMVIHTKVEEENLKGEGQGLIYVASQDCDVPKPGGPVDQPSTYGIPMGIAYLDTTLSCLIHRDSYEYK